MLVGQAEEGSWCELGNGKVGKLLFFKARWLSIHPWVEMASN